MPRRILLLVSSMKSGGAERVAANLANAWSARGESVTLVVTFSGRGQCAYPLSDQVKLIYLADLAMGRAGRGLWSYWARFLALRRLIRDSCPDVVLAFLTNVNVATLLASTGLRRSVLIAERTYPPAQNVSWIMNAMRRMTYVRASSVVMLTQEGLCWLNNRIPNARGVVIPNPVVVPLPQGEPILNPAQYITPERKMLLGVGRLDTGKQFDQLVESFAALAPHYPGWDLMVLGEGPERARLEQQTALLKLDKRVKLPGQAGNVGDWYNRADLFAMTSRFEGFPNTLVEAMSHGCAVVSYDCDTGPRDIIRHGVDGLLVTPVGHVPALTRALGRLMSNETERTRMASRAMESLERFSMERILRMWDDLIDVTSGVQRFS